MAPDLVIQGAKGGKGAGRTPVESRDSLRSAQYAEVVDLISEGPIRGLVTNDLRSVYLDGVPIQNADGSRNFKIDSFALNVGTQGQPALSGFDSAQSEIAVGIKVTSATPVVRLVPAGGARRIRITIGIPELSQQSVTTGDMTGASVSYAIDVQNNNGGYVERYSKTIDGKATTRYQHTVLIDLQGGGPWNVRVRRLTADSTTVTLRNELWFDSITLVNSARLRYPNSAVAGLRVAAENFSRIPGRGYLGYGRVIRVPSNYNTTTRSYSGAWDGTFKWDWTDNPAWIYYDLLTNTRYGLGRRIQAGKVDKWSLYRIGRYCDAVDAAGNFVGVPDGKGGVEPRFSCTLYLQQPGEAYRVLQDIAAVFRGIVAYTGGTISVMQDAPDDAYSLFTPANVVGGLFTYESSSERVKKSACSVWWNNPENLFKREQEYFQDPDLVAKYGLEVLELSPLGVVSRGQAIRIAKWALYTESSEGEMVRFSTGSAGAAVPLGRVFRVADPSVSGEQLGGLISSATSTSVTLDRPVTIRAGEVWTLHVMVPDTTQPMGLLTLSKPLINAAGVWTTLTLSSALAQVPPPQAPWVLESSAVAPTTWRCVRLAETKGDDGATIYEIAGVAHNPGKYDQIELGIKIDPTPVSRMREDAPVAAGPLQLRETVYRSSGVARSRVTIGWTPPAPGLQYRVSWRSAAGQWHQLPLTSTQSVDVDGVGVGLLEVAVRTVNPLGTESGSTLDGSLLITGRGGDTTNLVFKASFEDGVAGGWSAPVVDISPPTPLWSKALLITQRDTIEWDNIFTVTPDERLYVSASITAWRTPHPVSVGVMFLDASGGVLDFKAAITRSALSGWSRQSGWLTVPPGAAAGRPWVQIDGDPNQAPWPGAWITDIRISASEPAATRGAPAGTDVGGKAAEQVAQELNDIASDDKLTPVEKAQSITAWQAFEGERTGLRAEAGRYGVGAELVAYDASYSALAGYLTSLAPGWSDTSTTTTIDPTTWRARWVALQVSREALRNRISALTWQSLDDIANDGKLTPIEKAQAITAWQGIDGEHAGMLAEAARYGAAAEGGAYDAAYFGLASYLTSLAPGWNDTSTTTTIDPTTWRARWVAVQVSRQALQNRIASLTKQTLNDIADDGKLTPVEKSSAILEWQSLSGERPGLLDEASRYGISAERSSYDAEVTNLANYLVGLVPGWSDTATTTPIDPATWRARWLAVRISREVLRNRIAAVTKQGLDEANGRISDISADAKLTGSEKSALIISWREIEEGLPLLVAQASTFGIVAERDAALAARSALATYLTGLSPGWNDTTTTTAIDAAMFRDRWAAVYAARSALGVRIAEETSKRATWSAVSGAGKPEDGATVGAVFGPAGFGNIAGRIMPETLAQYVQPNTIHEGASVTLVQPYPSGTPSASASAQGSGLVYVAAMGATTVSKNSSSTAGSASTRMALVVNGAVVGYSCPTRTASTTGNEFVTETAAISWSGQVNGVVTAYVIAETSTSGGGATGSVTAGTNITILCLKS